MKYAHVLLPTDLSPESLRPLEYAPELFAGKRVTFLHVVENYYAMAVSSPFAPSMEDPTLHERMEKALEELEKIRGTLSDTAEVQCIVVPGQDLGRTVSEWAAENDADLIAVSTHGRTGIRRFVLGSVADRILRYAHTPVLCFPPKASEG